MQNFVEMGSKYRQTGVRSRELLEADGPRLGEDLEGAKEDGAVGGGRRGGGDLRRVAAGDSEEAPEAKHVGRAGLEQQVRRCEGARAKLGVRETDWVVTMCRRVR
jgi:hypothetical protein